MRVNREFGLLARLWKYVFREVDASSLAVFRICFGGLLLFESINYGLFLCLDCMYRSSVVLFKYQHFEWVTLLPGNGLEWVLALMGISAMGVMLGWYYRLCSVLLLLCFSYHFLLDQALYLNHFYMVMLISAIMIFLPANRIWSVDASRAKSRGGENTHSTIPNWALVWMAFQLEIILIYAGLVKLNYDWLNLEPLRLWMQVSAADEATIFQWLTHDPGIALASYGVILLHIVGAPLLLFKKTRLAVFLVYCVFHIMNTFVFNIGIFPWLTLAATLLLFDPDWPRQAIAWLNSKGWCLQGRHLAQGVVVAQVPKQNAWQIVIVAFMGIWLLLQALIPLRHYTMPGNVAWNEAGHQFSWRMKLRDKRGTVLFRVVDSTNREWRVKPDRYLNQKQLYRIACIPGLVWQFAQMLDTEYSLRTGAKVAVYADTSCSLNTRKPVPLVNQQIDLSIIPRDHPTSAWLYSLTEPLPRPLFHW
ncbi:MAG: HTTM domain-containing protein [Granulosicoccaceae bacterium]